MGYDIYVQSPDGKRLFGPENYCRLTSLDMSKVLDAMEHFGMIYEAPAPAFPALADFQLTGNLANGAESDPETQERAAAYIAAYRAVENAADPEPAGIPEYKLEYSGAFLITVAEITAALACYDAHPGVEMAEAPMGAPTWRNWIAFLRRAKTYGGLRTH
ncbi:hypothetical protein [Streptomyces sp. NPDC056891]|uniref:hypothetical protein n=1 Tax=unclassified Streptomyces TaxID=2593676 RepID=UPI0036C6938F